MLNLHVFSFEIAFVSDKRLSAKKMKDKEWKKDVKKADDENPGEQ